MASTDDLYSGVAFRGKVLVVVLSSLLLVGCATPFLQQGSNQFNSNTYVGWIPPDRGDAADLTGLSAPAIWTMNVRGRTTGGKYVVRENDCFAVDYAGGYLHDSFEGHLEKTWAWLTGRSPRSEFSIVLKAEQRIPEGRRGTTASDLKEVGTFVFSNTGQLRNRHFTGNSYETFYGPARYRGGELQLTVSIAEQDQEEYSAMVRDSVSFAKSANKIDGNDGEGKKKGTAYFASLLSSASSSDVARLTVSPLGYVAVAAEAVKAGAYMLQAINQESDNVMKESITLVDALDPDASDPRPRPVRPLLRYGTYVFARASVDINVASEACIIYSSSHRTAKARFAACPTISGTSLPPDYPEDWTTVTAVAINLRPVSDAMCRATTAPPAQGSATGVVSP